MFEQMAQPYLIRVIEEDKDQIASKLSSLWNSKKDTITLAGFRQGKVPQNIAEAKMGFENLYKEYLDEIIINAINETSSNEGVDIVDLQQVVPEKLDKNGIVLQLVTYLKPEVEQLDFTNLKLKSLSSTPEASEVDAQLEQYRQSQAQIKPVTDRGVQFGDMVVISYVGSLNGIPFQGGTTTRQQLILNESSFIPGFGEAMLGLLPSEQKTFEVVFPDNYHATQLAGKKASFDLTVHEVKVKQIPELDDELAVTNGFISLDEMRSEVTKALQESKQKLNKSRYETEICSELLHRAKIQPIPQTMIQKRLNFLLQTEAANNNLSPEEYLSKRNIDKDTFDRTYYSVAVRDIKVQLVLDYVAQKAGLQASEQEKASYLQSEAEKVGLTLEEAAKRVTLDQLEMQIKLHKAYDYLLLNTIYE